jgi:hypothetical protein
MSYEEENTMKLNDREENESYVLDDREAFR